MKEQSEKTGKKLNIQKTKVMASSPITLWQIDGGKMEIMTDFIFVGSKITVDADCSHELKDACSLEKKLWYLDTVLKSTDVTLPTKGHLVKSMVFPVVMYRSEI